MRRFVSKFIFFYLFIATFAMITANSTLSAQITDPQDPETPVATEAEKLGSAQVTDEPEPTDGFTQTDDTRSLQDKIKLYNSEFCPPQTPITQINRNALIMLVEFQLLDRTELDKFDDMVMINEEVYEKKDTPQDTVDPPRQDFEPTDNNLDGSFEQSCIEVENEKTRGIGKGNQDPERNISLRQKTITYRDKKNQLQRMIIYFPPVYPVKNKPIEGKAGETIKDYATSVLVPKDGDVSNDQNDKFENMPSSTGLVEQPGTGGGTPEPGTNPQQ
ncbi:MAG: hypothetical protein ACQETH_06890 [Candidatus Rifleibacteriota bacterium]